MFGFWEIKKVPQRMSSNVVVPQFEDGGMFLFFVGGLSCGFILVVVTQHHSGEQCQIVFLSSLVLRAMLSHLVLSHCLAVFSMRRFWWPEALQLRMFCDELCCCVWGGCGLPCFRGVSGDTH